MTDEERKILMTEPQNATEYLNKVDLAVQRTVNGYTTGGIRRGYNFMTEDMQADISRKVSEKSSSRRVSGNRLSVGDDKRFRFFDGKDSWTVSEPLQRLPDERPLTSRNIVLSRQTPEGDIATTQIPYTTFSR